MTLPDETIASPSPVAHDVTVEGVVNAPAMVTLYDDDGLAMQVAAEDVNAWLAKGMKRERFDVHGKKTELCVMADSFKQAVVAFVDSAVANGTLNTAAGKEMDVVQVAMRDLEDSFIGLMQTVAQRYPVAQPLSEPEPESDPAAEANPQ